VTVPVAGRLLELLRERSGAYCSGEELSGALGVSRTAVWKHVHQLEAAGYQIAAAPHLGYRLLSSPDALLPAEIRAGLASKLFARNLLCFRETTSTNDRALDLAARGAPEGTVVAAESQTQGRGRAKRTWLSKPYANLLFSFVLRPAWPLEQAPLLTLLAAAAVARAVRAQTGLPAVIKWPNDVLVRGAKVAGILSEMRAQADLIDHLVCGIGINVNAAPAGPVRTRAASLSGLTGRPVARLPLLRRVLDEVDTLYAAARKRGPAYVLEQWEPLSAMNGAAVAVDTANGERVEGTAMGVDETGALLVRLESGLTRRFFSGEVTLSVAEP
jgi:BirA family transcriptional regulator, biotin operon repressor / biotin---[acetyl-CoA-carboxylase] ligase